MIEWGSLEGQAVHMVILLAPRESGANGSHMQVLSRLARKPMHEEFPSVLLSAANREALLDHLSAELAGAETQAEAR
jgi:mannitol/fructose-specific phosphotransferase system IIA component (Ntr-type)